MKEFLLSTSNSAQWLCLINVKQQNLSYNFWLLVLFEIYAMVFTG